MDELKIDNLSKGDYCFCAGVRCKVVGVKTTGIAAPYYRLVPVASECPPEKASNIKGWASYRLCSLEK